MYQQTGEKKTLSRYGKIDIDKKHVYSEAVSGFQISPYMQEKMVYAAQANCYGEATEALSKYLGVEVSVMQVHRVANKCGAELEKQKIAAQIEPSTQRQHEKLAKIKPDEMVYGQADGLMLLTRKEGWKEVKVGRVFKESDCLSIGSGPSTGDERGWIQHSEYEACLGNSRKFTKRFETQTDPYLPLGKRLVFVSDGATWIKNWIEDTYPKATQVLDWYHCKQHLCEFAEEFFKDKTEKQSWIDQQAGLLYESQAVAVIKNIQTLSARNKQQLKAKKSLLKYYENNLQRMDYKRYRSMGAGIIGSGAIEAANRTVVQKRMKLSGQRWSSKGAQHMLNLRTANLSDNWNKVVELINQPLKKAA